MKLLFAFCLLCTGALRAQTTPAATSLPLSGTKWSATLNVPTPENCLLVFSRDSIYLINRSNRDSVLLERMVYRQHGDTLTLRKTDGGSPCGTGDDGVYLLRAEGDKLFVKALNDPCLERSDAFSDRFTRVP